ncbi:two-component system sensor histidine kinase NtrB [Desulfobulbus alkaliphilus]|uniref:two-component system sensor histidine kinase NtrB n=1 Tax=Desulfobulbus alkaliphilus TaxID=869814 RepID=UPI001962C43C|nr:ATP-binding protein [Desulfobulbus alkaliphilus]MBM9537144.1 PAS domain-containing protein [Desulfobulbus alkaliphilus]
MILRLRNLTRPAYISTSPWLLAAAAGLLIMIVVTFAFHNFRLEQRLMTSALLQKAATLMRVLDSGSRASYINDLRKDYWNNDPWNLHVQRVIDHLAEDPDLRFLALVDAQGKVIAHSDHSRIGTLLPLPEVEGLGDRTDQQPRMVYAIQVTKEYGRVFEAVRPFTTAFPTLIPTPMRQQREGQRGIFLQNQDERRPMVRFFPRGNEVGEGHLVLVGLDMKEYDRTLGRLRLQILMLSLAMLLVGLGGWFSLSAVQGYRISQKTLVEIQAFTSLLIAKLPVGVVATDASGRITTWNQAVVELTGMARDTVVGRKPQEVLPEILAAFFLDVGTVVTDHENHFREQTIKVIFGGRRCEILCHPLLITDSEQQYMGKVLLLSDVTAIKSLEQRMRENERLAAVGRMAGGVAHEVRNPLSSIKGLALLLKNRFPSGSKEQDTADLLIQETERMNRTITEMLSFTRPTALHLEQVDLPVLLQRSLQLIKAEAADSRITTVMEVEDGIVPIRGDVDRLQQVMMNVLLNAMQAMEEGGTLTVALANLEQGEGVELRITDTGSGIAPELLSQVFYPYFTTKPSGTGIGLAISQKIILDHGGSIDMESEPGKGTTVIIRLPTHGPGQGAGILDP